MRIPVLAVVLILSACKSSKKDYDFTFYKGNIHESYFLKFNSSDTMYYVDAYGYNKEETFFTILNKDEKERIQNVLEAIKFPKNDAYENNMIEDGETNAFLLKHEKQSNKLMIHGGKGPNEFWLLGKSLDQIKANHQFIKTNKKIDFKEMKKILLAPPPPIIDSLK